MKEINELLDLIRKKREEKGISQRQIADYLGISQPAYRNIESGQTSLKVETLVQVASYLGIDIFQNNESSQNLVSLNPDDIVKKINKLDVIDEATRQNAKEIKEINQKLDELLDLFGKKKKK